MAYRLLRHPAVAGDLLDIADLIGGYAGAEIAFNKLDETEQRLKALAETPHVGTVRDEIYPGLRVVPVARKGVITFVVDDAARAALIVSITYAGADWYKAVGERG